MASQEFKLNSSLLVLNCGQKFIGHHDYLDYSERIHAGLRMLGAEDERRWVAGSYPLPDFPAPDAIFDPRRYISVLKPED